jgi:hypothetical protein
LDIIIAISGKAEIGASESKSGLDHCLTAGHIQVTKARGN